MDDAIQTLIELALAEDIGSGDVTAAYFIPQDRLASATIAARKAGVISGLAIAARVFQQVDPSLEVTTLVADGSAVQAGDAVLQVSGKARSILTTERTALNFLQRLSG
ncbi:MAG TPA: nicotinate-nucleotide diphosphorylase (carboxylating), partial [Luteolibacter sp.]|nr:nicotinate-nucleotide diphosphorylase (carboxylating) [Luteolibacter sp.]